MRHQRDDKRAQAPEWAAASSRDRTLLTEGRGLPTMNTADSKGESSPSPLGGYRRQDGQLHGEDTGQIRRGTQHF
eukprot:1159886-Pelagomonas_calceolata.AAC.5